MRPLIWLIALLVAVWVASAHPLLRISAEALGHVCPDGTSECVNESTCCRMGDGSYSCCPLVEAVCCDKGVYCCPKDHTCNGTLCVNTKKNTTVPYTAVKFSKTRDLTEETCPDKNKCSTGTCCQQTSGSWGCCKFENAVCCADKLSCCPEEFDCDSISHTCIRKERYAPAVLSLGRQAQFSLDGVTCPDKTQCPDGNVCCKTSNTFRPYFCCPLPGGTCCSDNRHCCPEGYQCVLTNGTYTCNKQLLEKHWLQKIS